MIDIGANLTDKSFRSDVDAVIARAVSAQIKSIIVTGTDVGSSKSANSLCQKYPSYLYSTAGVHPHTASKVESNWIEELRKLARDQNVVAIGETGLDYFRNFSPREDQRQVFLKQLQLAVELDMPAFIHDRDSDGELLECIRRYPKLKAVVHCFTGSKELLQQYLELGLYIGITGWVCDERRGMELKDSVHLIPDDRILIETDAPYLMPRNIRPRPKTRRNEPANLPYVAQVVASARNQTISYLTTLTTENAKRLFALR